MMISNIDRKSKRIEKKEGFFLCMYVRTIPFFMLCPKKNNKKKLQTHLVLKRPSSLMEVFSKWDQSKTKKILDDGVKRTINT